MTREELKEHCKKQIEMCEFWAKSRGEEPCGKPYEEHKMVLELLEQQSSEDAISRQAVDTLVDELARAISDERCCISRGRSTAIIMQDILDLPPITPQPKIGHWIESKGYDDRDHFYTCSECGRNINLICGATLADYPYCHCGAKMEVEE